VAGVTKADFDSALSSDDLGWLVSLSALWVLLKGIVHPDEQAVRRWRDPRHPRLQSWSRQLASFVPALDALSAVVDVVAGYADAPRWWRAAGGTNVLTALVLRTRTVLIGDRSCGVSPEMDFVADRVAIVLPLNNSGTGRDAGTKGMLGGEVNRDDVGVLLHHGGYWHCAQDGW
jgi:hypothetical protein